jgi:para-nitrobenzyl esterase
MTERVVETSSGPVLGTSASASTGGVEVFWGVPFAAPPEGALRFRAPEPPTPWTEPRDCTQPGAAVPHKVSALGELIGLSTEYQGSDCLHVTVWRPESRGDTPLPVMVWIHGGSFEAGAASNPIANGAELCARGNVIVVSLQYRTGILGFLSLPGAPENRGFLDQIAALEWTRNNIAKFGGNAENITLFGSSAGGVSAALLFATQAQRGLFRRVIVQSGGAEWLHTDTTATLVRRELARELGLQELPDDALREALEETPTQALVDAQRALINRLEDSLGGVVFQPVRDHQHFATPPLVRVARGECRDVTLFVGTNADEMNILSLMNLFDDPLTADQARQKSATLIGTPAEHPLLGRILQAYADAGCAPQAQWERFATDLCFRYPAMRLAEAHCKAGGETYMYLFDFKSPAFGGCLGASHAIEIPFIFGSHTLPIMESFLGDEPEVATTSRNVSEVWTTFARTGTPATTWTGPWRTYDPSTRFVKRLAASCSDIGSAFVDVERIWREAFAHLRPVPGYDYGHGDDLPRTSRASSFPAAAL